MGYGYIEIRKNDEKHSTGTDLAMDEKAIVYVNGEPVLTVHGDGLTEPYSDNDSTHYAVRWGKTGKWIRTMPMSRIHALQFSGDMWKPYTSTDGGETWHPLETDD